MRKKKFLGCLPSSQTSTSTICSGFLSTKPMLVSSTGSFLRINTASSLWLMRSSTSENLLRKALTSSQVKFFYLKINSGFDPELALNYINNLSLFWANIETYTFKDKQHMNQVMEKYIHKNGESFHAWNTYITLEQYPF